MTEDEARMIGKAIREEAQLLALAIQDPMERRAICLKLAIETKGVALLLKNDATVAESAERVVDAARLYFTFVSGERTERPANGNAAEVDR